MYVNEPTDKPYTNKEGKQIYPKFYFLARELKDQIAEDAIQMLHAQDVQTAQNAMGGGTFDPDDVPFF